MSCCRPRAYERVFGARTARNDLRRYRKRGLKRDARAALEFLRRRGLAGRTLLEPGGGIGALQVEALRAGAAGTVNVELSPEYERVATELLAAEGLAGRVERRLGDFVEVAPEPADAVAMIRVVCCYPDPDRLVGAAADRARETLVLSCPRDDLPARAVAAAGNLLLRLARHEFRAYAHPHARIVAAAERHGLRLALHRRALVWHTFGFERGDGTGRFGATAAGNADGMDEHREDDPAGAERAEDATEEARRERGDMPIEEQTGLGAGREDDDKPRPF